jgi:hypothetical protein
MMNARQFGWLVSVLGGAFAIGAIWFIGWGSQPANSEDRFWLVMLALTVIGIPLGISLGTQKKFYL